MNTIKFINTLEDKSTESIRQNLYKNGILCNYNSIDGRMVAYSSKNNRFRIGPNSELIDECNGLVIDTKNIKILVRAPEAFKSNIDPNIVNNNLHNNLYDMFLIDDGTVINIYYWALSNSWRISTTRSYDVTDMKWGNTTYGEIVNELLLTHMASSELFYESLNKDTCYTFGFKHSSMHPFSENSNECINKLWFIQSDNSNKISYNFENTFNIPCQIKYEFPIDIPKNTKHLFNSLNESFDRFNCNGDILYGYILRTKDKSITNEHSNIILESSLLQKIRQCYYHSSFNETAKTMNYDRETYTIIYAYLNANSHDIFIKLFPKFQPQFYKLNNITSNIVKQVINHSHNPDINSPLHATIKFIYESLNSQYTITTKARNNSTLIRTFILNHKFIDLYYSLFTHAC